MKNRNTLYSAIIASTLLVLTSFQVKPDIKLRLGFYSYPPVGHAITFYEVTTDKIFLYHNVVGSWYATGNYKVNLSDSSISVHYLKTYCSKSLTGQKMHLVADEKIKLLSDKTGSLVFQELKFESKDDFYKAHSKIIKKSSTVRVK